MNINDLSTGARDYLKIALEQFGLNKPWLKSEIVQSAISAEVNLYLTMNLLSFDDTLKLDDSFKIIEDKMDLIARAISTSPYVESYKKETERLKKENQKLIEQNRELYLLIDGAHLAKFGKRMDESIKESKKS